MKPVFAVQKCPADPLDTTYQGSGSLNPAWGERVGVWWALSEEEGGSGTGPLSQCLGVRDLGHMSPDCGPGSSGYPRVKSPGVISVGHLASMMKRGGTHWVCFDGKL